MKAAKRVLSLILALILALGMVPPARASQLPDETSPPASEAPVSNTDSAIPDLDSEKYGIDVPAKPHKIANVVSGVHVYWKAVQGASKYGLWRSETGVNGTYKWVANPTVPHFTDTNVVSGKTYHYKVTAMNAAGTHSGKSAAIGTTFVSTPDITIRKNKAAGITLGWEKVDGATGYAIYRKSGSGTDAWVRVATVDGNTTFTWQDTSVKSSNGSVYKYTIRALAGSDRSILSGCRSAGRTMVRLCSQTLTSAVPSGSTSIKCTWTTSGKVTGYEVRFMVNGKVYKTFTVGNYKTGAKTFTDLMSGQTYQIQVRTYKKLADVGTFYSAWSPARYVVLEEGIAGTYLARFENVKIVIKEDPKAEYLLTYTDTASGITLNDIPLAYYDHNTPNEKWLMFFIDDYYPQYSGYVEFCWQKNEITPYFYNSLIDGLADTDGYYSDLIKN